MEETILFGKNRHLFGGIEPSNMLEFTAEYNSILNNITITATPPNDTIIDGQTLCSVEGVVIRKRTDNYPVNEFDGEELITITEPMTITDTNVDADGTYYYAAFPYTKQGVYNRSTQNRVVVNEPACMSKFFVKSKYDSTSDSATVTITAELPNGVDGAIIRKSASRYPVDENDGEMVIDITSNGSYMDADVDLLTTYYYAAFPYNDHKAYNRSSDNRCSCTTRKCSYYYGYDLDTTNPDPTTRVSYVGDIDNIAFEPAYMDYNGATFNAGGWSIAPGEEFMPKPCMLKYDGSVAYYLNPNDYAQREDGVTASDYNNTAFEGNVMMEWPKIYTYREEVDGIYKFRCSDAPNGDKWDCWCNYDKNGNQIDHFYTSVYTLGLDSVTRDHSKGRSIAGTVAFYDNANSSTYYSHGGNKSLATANGDDWDMLQLSDRLLIQDLLVMMAKTTDTQTAYGLGANGTNNRIPLRGRLTATSGSTAKAGMFRGYNDSTMFVRVFGMDNFWGNDKLYIDGWSIASGVQTIGIKNVKTGIVLDPVVPSSVSSQTTVYSGKMLTTDYGRIPIYDDSGSSSTYECDELTTINSSTFRVFCVGGGLDASGRGGAFAAEALVSGSNTLANSSTFLSVKPSLAVE